MTDKPIDNKQRNKPVLEKRIEELLLETGQCFENTHGINTDIIAAYLVDQLDVFLDAAYQVKQQFKED